MVLYLIKNFSSYEYLCFSIFPNILHVYNVCSRRKFAIFKCTCFNVNSNNMKKKKIYKFASICSTSCHCSILVQCSRQVKFIFPVSSQQNLHPLNYIALNQHRMHRARGYAKSNSPWLNFPLPRNNRMRPEKNRCAHMVGGRHKPTLGKHRQSFANIQARSTLRCDISRRRSRFLSFRDFPAKSAQNQAVPQCFPVVPESALRSFRNAPNVKICRLVGKYQAGFDAAGVLFCDFHLDKQMTAKC